MICAWKLSLMCWHRLVESLAAFLSLRPDYQSGTICVTRTYSAMTLVDRRLLEV